MTARERAYKAEARGRRDNCWTAVRLNTENPFPGAISIVCPLENGGAEIGVILIATHLKTEGPI